MRSRRTSCGREPFLAAPQEACTGLAEHGQSPNGRRGAGFAFRLRKDCSQAEDMNGGTTTGRAFSASSTARDAGAREVRVAVLVRVPWDEPNSDLACAALHRMPGRGALIHVVSAERKKRGNMEPPVKLRLREKAQWPIVEEVRRGRGRDPAG